MIIIFRALTVAVGGLVLSGTTFGESSKTEVLPIRVRLGWYANANSAGQIAAKELGYYEESGLSVEFSDGGLTTPSVKTVASREDSFGFANGPELVISARAAGVPIRICAIIHRRSYHRFFVRENSGIYDPRDWPNKRIGVKAGSPTYLQYLAILEKMGIDRTKIEEIPLGYDPRPFISGDVDVYPGALTNEALTIKAAGIGIRAIDPNDFGVPTIGTVLFSSEKFLADRPDVAASFIKATMRGWEWCRNPENHKATIAFLLKYNNRLSPENEEQALRATLPLVGDGVIEPAVLGTIAELQYKLGVVPRLVSLDELIIYDLSQDARNKHDKTQ